MTGSNTISTSGMALSVIIAGVLLRFWAATQGHNFDVDSYRIVADIVNSGGNVYAETRRYNYGPVWFYILHFLDIIPVGGSFSLESLRYKVTFFLTCVDVALFVFLLKRYSMLTACLFLLNPISIIITGYHSQFDNFAILVGLLAVYFYQEYPKLRFYALVGFGFSLSIKHVLFLFPFWVALKEKTWVRKIIVILVPYVIFLLGFVFFIPEGGNGILKHVFLYKSFNNGPFWEVFAPSVLLHFVPKILLFIGTLIVLGFVFRKRQILESFYIYLIVMVVFTSALTNQYLAIPLVAIAIFWNPFYAFYTFTGLLYLFVEKDGLHFYWMQDLLHWKGAYGYYIMVILLFSGFLWTFFGKNKLLGFIAAILDKVRREILIQIKAPLK